MTGSPWARHIATLDPVTDHATIARLLSHYEFPWDFQQALSFALFRTFAVPSIGALLHETGEFTRRTQKRYDDTALILDAILEHGPTTGDGREALRRMNRMHGAYGIAADDLRYVLCTFVTMPIRWVDAYGHRRLTAAERVALARSYHELGRHMGIPDPPTTPEEFADLLDAYEAEHFAYSEGGRAVADATLDLFATFPPFGLLPFGAAVSRQAAYAIVQRNAMASWNGRTPFLELLRADPEVTARLPEAELAGLFDYQWYLANIGATFERLGL